MFSIQHDVKWNNKSAYQVWISHHENNIANMRDSSGCTLLHRAVLGMQDLSEHRRGERGGCSILLDLLARGIDPELKGTPMLPEDILPSSVAGQAVTAQALAASYGSEVEAWYLQALIASERLGTATEAADGFFQHQLAPYDDDSDSECIFWDAQQ